MAQRCLTNTPKRTSSKLGRFANSVVCFKWMSIWTLTEIHPTGECKNYPTITRKDNLSNAYV